jgi:mono/diheme cytochrome c family protein
MFKLLALLPAALLFAFLPQEPAVPAAQPAAPADATAAMTNPVKPTAESQAHAKKIFGEDCAMCHGDSGDGKGDLVADMHLTMKDLTDPNALNGMSDGDLFGLIKTGKGKMPGEGDRAKDAVIWNLVIYVRSLSKK